jgi:hypothetical protein
MKRIILLIVLSIGSISLWANDHNGSAKDISRISRLLPDNVAQSKVKDILGTATYIDINNKNGEESWHYKNEDDNTDYYFRWDKRYDRLKTMSYSCSTPIKLDWSNNNLALFEMNRTTPAQVMSVLGDPNNLNVSSNGEVSLKYVYADNNQVEVHFKDGTLMNIRVSAYRK